MYSVDIGNFSQYRSIDFHLTQKAHHAWLRSVFLASCSFVSQPSILPMLPVLASWSFLSTDLHLIQDRARITSDLHGLHCTQVMCCCNPRVFMSHKQTELENVSTCQ